MIWAGAAMIHGRRMRKKARRSLVAIAAVLAVCLGPAMPVSAREFEPGAGQSSAPRLGEGVGGDIHNSLTGGRQTTKNQCRRWRAAAFQLGETYAGHRLRRTAVRRHCPLLESARADETWDWPWSSLGDGRVVPPRLRMATGAWEIRCGAARARRRCALLHRGPMLGSAARGAYDASILTHFVIDTVGRREIVLWRVYVPVAAPATASLQESMAMTAGVAGRHGRGRIHYELEGAEQTEVFPACAPTGCLMEANVWRAGSVATSLWDGRPLDLRVELGTQPPILMTVPAAGFKSGLKELMRLRREEVRASRR